jgi:hypothetical protein
MLGISPQLSDADARKIGGMWGPDPVHPSEDVYKEIAAAIDAEVSDGTAKYTNPPRPMAGDNPKRSRLDLSSSRQEWVTGCSATLPRRDTISGGGGTGAPPREPAGAAADAVAEAGAGVAPISKTFTSPTGRSTETEGGARTPRGRLYAHFMCQVFIRWEALYVLT